MKTSKYDPIRVKELPIVGGDHDMTFCPEKHDTSLISMLARIGAPAPS